MEFNDFKVFIVDKARLSLQAEGMEPTKGYHERGRRPRLRVVLSEPAGDLIVTSSTELLEVWNDRGVNVARYASNHPEALAASFSFLNEQGRLVCNNPFFESAAEQYGLDVEDFLSRWEAPILIWYELGPDSPELSFSRREQLIHDNEVEPL